jgi:hypothetical protein
MNFLVFEFLKKEDEEHQKKIKIFREDITFYFAFVVSSWPYRLEKPILYSSFLKYRSANFFFINPDPQSLEKVIWLDPNTFNFLLSKYIVWWEKSKEIPLKTKGSLSLRSLSSAASLGLILHWLATRSSLINLNLFVGTILLTMSHYLFFTLDCLYKTVISIKKGMLQPSSDIYLKNNGKKMGQTYGNVFYECVMVIDESIHTLEKDAAANSNFFY